MESVERSQWLAFLCNSKSRHTLLRLPPNIELWSTEPFLKEFVKRKRFPLGLVRNDRFCFMAWLGVR